MRVPQPVSVYSLSLLALQSLATLIPSPSTPDSHSYTHSVTTGLQAVKTHRLWLALKSLSQLQFPLRVRLDVHTNACFIFFFLQTPQEIMQNSLKLQQEVGGLLLLTFAASPIAI